MLNMRKSKKLIRATIKNLIVAFVYAGLLIIIIFFLFQKQIKQVSSFVNLISIKTTNKILEDVIIDTETKSLKSYPKFGTKYATINITSLDISLPVYYGDTLSILKKGIGHSSGSYFPGEGGSILYMGHNTSDMLRNLSNIQLGDEIKIETTYGQFLYEVYDTKVINYKDLNQVPIQRNEEILMIYTCHPATAIGYTPNRFIVYAKLVQSEI